MSTAFSSTAASERSPLLADARPNGNPDAVDPKPAPPRRRGWLANRTPSIWGLLAPISLAEFAVGLTILPFQTIFIYRACMEVGIDPYKNVAACRANAEANGIAVGWKNINRLISFPPGFLAGPITGALVDRSGRKPFLLGFTLNSLIYDLSLFLAAGGAPIAIVFAAEFIYALCGYQAQKVASNAYISDISAPADRARSFALTESLSIVSSLLAPFVGGLLASYASMLGFNVGGDLQGGTGASANGVTVPLVVAAALLVVAGAWIGVGVPESLPAKRAPALDDPHVDVEDETGAVKPAADAVPPPPTLWQLFLATWRDTLASFALLNDTPLLILTAYRFLASFFGAGLGSVVIYFTSLQFGWGEKEIATYFLWAALNRMLQLSVVLPALLAWFERGWGWGRGAAGKRSVYERTVFEIRIVMVCTALFGVGYTVFAFLKEGWQVFVLIAFESFAACSGPIFYSLLSKTVSNDVQGRMMGAVTLVQTVAGLSGSVIISYIYTRTVRVFPGLAFVLMGGYAVVAVVLLALVSPRRLADRIEMVAAAGRREAGEGEEVGSESSEGTSVDE
ncbi:hypothetical protein HDU96_002197 [Phlyctochytrium bullatum]|nr:hypothetical protein HDU96_002197 [Phlyctochytrium bullatum]